ncbi:CocE/NonD family hydrolase [Amnibacterium endophyticum]|uniref:CocE/NonD family hydrolase n=1 Tax=Amnibacterium endophyticum TaxID=2109337 RepID=A0ABW4LI09_9MICO
MRRSSTTLSTLLKRRVIELFAGQPAGSVDFTVTADLGTPMADGTVLLGDLYRPLDAGPQPVVLIRTPYGRSQLLGRVFATVLARRGFTVFQQSVRGTFGSGGVFRPFTDEHRDGLDTLAWVRRQEWCDGRVATTGASYFGHTQWAVAPYADPPLVALSLHITSASIRDLFYEHGAPGSLNAIGWSDSIARQEEPQPAPLLAGFGRRRRVVRALSTRPLREADVTSTGQPVPFWRDFTEHAAPGDAFWDVADHDGADLTRMPPVNMVTGWWDLFLQAQLHDYAALRAAGVPARLTIGPWLHGRRPELQEILRSDLEWLEHHLQGGPAPEGAAVRVQLQGTDDWLGFETWPPPQATTDRRYLTADAALAAEPPERAVPPSTFTFHPDDPTVFDGGPLLFAPAAQTDDWRAEQGIDVLVLTGQVEPADLDVVGPVRATLHVRPERDHADVVVRLCDVDEQGVSRNVVDGIRRLDPKTVPADDVTVGDDGVLTVDVELFPTAYRFAKGHRLRLVVAGGAFPRFAPNPGTGRSLAESTDGPPCRFEVFHDAQHPSHLRLPVLPADAARVPAPGSPVRS